jgi:hypothetical protein
MTETGTVKQGYSVEHEAIDLKVMIGADAGHLARALERGERVNAKTYVDAIIDNRRRLEDIERLLAGRARRALGGA